MTSARALIDVFERPTDHWHLLRSSHAVSRAEAKLRQLHGDLEQLRSVSVSTDF